LAITHGSQYAPITVEKMGNKGSNLFTRFIVLAVLGVAFYQVLLPMIGNTIKIYSYSQQSSRIQNSPVLLGTIISDKTVYTDFQVIPRVYKNKVIHGHKILAQGLDRNGKIDFVRVEFWGASSSFLPMSKINYKVDPVLGENAEITNSSLYTKKIANLTILLTSLVAFLLVFSMYLTMFIPSRWGNLSLMARNVTVFTPITLVIVIFCLSRFLYMTT